MSEPPRHPLMTRILRTLLWGIGAAFGLFVVVCLLAMWWPLELGKLLLLGWIHYLAEVIPRITFNAEIALDALGALGLATAGLHRILRWVRRQHAPSAEWRFAWTAKITAMVLLLFATAVAATGIVHQVGWMFWMERWTEDRNSGRMGREMSNLRQVAIALKLYAEDHEDRLPRDLEALVADYLEEPRLFFSEVDPGEPPERILYFPDDHVATPAETIILAGPLWTRRGKRVVAWRNGQVTIENEADFQEAMRHQTKK